MTWFIICILLIILMFVMMGYSHYRITKAFDKLDDSIDDLKISIAEFDESLEELEEHVREQNKI